MNFSHPQFETASDRSITEIESQLERTSNALERLHSRVTGIEERLRPVMRATGSGVNGTGAAVPKEALSPLGDAIRSIEGRVDSAVERLEALLASLAL